MTDRPTRTRSHSLSRLKMLTAFLGFSFMAVTGHAQQGITVKKVQSSGPAPSGTVIFDGVSAGNFQPSFWIADSLNWVPDLQSPVLPPLPGRFRNIYSASAVEEPWGWRVFYSGWDGSSSQNDRTYASKTKDFVNFTDRKVVIDHGAFQHVSNVSVQKLPDGTYQMLTTAYYTGDGPYKETEKPAVMHSNNGESWNGSAIPYEPKIQDTISVAGYQNYNKARLNGASELFQDKGQTLLLFKDWIYHPGVIYWASGPDATHLTLGGTALETIMSPNDMRKFTVAGRDWYLLALYKKGDVGIGRTETEHLWYSLSDNGHTFHKEQKLVDAIGGADRFPFSVSFVTKGQSLLGVLYGAGTNVNFAENQIFATWLQKRVELVASPSAQNKGGGQSRTDGALGPDRQRYSLPGGGPFDGTLNLYAEDGKTLVGSTQVHLDPGAEYRITY